MVNNYGHQWPSQSNYPSLDDELDLSANHDEYQLMPEYSYSYQHQQPFIPPLIHAQSSAATSGDPQLNISGFNQRIYSTQQNYSSSSNKFDQHIYSAQQNLHTHPGIATGNISNDYQNTHNAFNFSANSTVPNSTSHLPSNSNSLSQTLNQGVSRFHTNTNLSLGSQNKRPRQESHPDEPEMEAGVVEHKDAKAKLYAILPYHP